MDCGECVDYSTDKLMEDDIWVSTDGSGLDEVNKMFPVRVVEPIQEAFPPSPSAHFSPSDLLNLVSSEVNGVAGSEGLVSREITVGIQNPLAPA